MAYQVDMPFVPNVPPAFFSSSPSSLYSVLFSRPVLVTPSVLCSLFVWHRRGVSVVEYEFPFLPFTLLRRPPGVASFLKG